MPGSGSAHLLTPFEALSSVRFSFRMSRSASRVYKPFSFQCSPFESSVGAFSLLIRVGVAREQSEKTSNWEGDPPGELTVPQTDTGEQVEYTRALERTMSKELGKMTPERIREYGERIEGKDGVELLEGVHPLYVRNWCAGQAFVRGVWIVDLLKLPHEVISVSIQVIGKHGFGLLIRKSIGTGGEGEVGV
ncbi:hypothetical protein Tco_1121660 [Tanacetum coccineum]|uniref:Uncharacterized protein n=1 Tax=Tanacetum coccineum TaxID=301880 RepID=A0ABQ5IZQ2_9ASTR